MAIFSNPLFATYSVYAHNASIEGLCERTEYVPQLWNWENHC